MYKILFLTALVFFLFYVVLQNHRPHKTVSKDYWTLNSCPQSPNCCTSLAPLASLPSQLIAPFPLIGSNPMQRLTKVIKSQGYKILVHEPHYIHVVATTPFFRFSDDLEFLFTPDHIEVRSISRLGYYDFQKNKERLQALRKLYEKQS